MIKRINFQTTYPFQLFSFSIPIIKNVREPKVDKNKEPHIDPLRGGYKRLSKTFKWVMIDIIFINQSKFLENCKLCLNTANIKIDSFIVTFFHHFFFDLSFVLHLGCSSKHFLVSILLCQVFILDHLFPTACLVLSFDFYLPQVSVIFRSWLSLR